MRIIFLLMMVANLVVAGWWGYWHYHAADATTSAGLATVQAGGAPRLRLLQELPAVEQQPLPLVMDMSTVSAMGENEAKPAGSEVTGEASAPKVKTRCYRVDNIERKEERDALATKMAAQNLVVLERGEAFHERKVYWVHIPPLKSSATASSVVALLANAKVRDFFLVRAGDTKNAISLGLFSQREGAEKRLQEIAALKLAVPPPTMRERSSTVRNYWLTARESGEGELLLQKIVQSEKRLAVAIECPP